ncbi:MAG: response regulator [Hydrococcus sp. C42_A2020_068]|uniref:response regulator n=1 Tax=Pleurocapsa sp. PCC 7327 TaxID=118163 RepID=UPI00029F94E4|nr:response regulator [Pleurocapsa sp. PCC 7327]AFY79435.1 response regulator with CheY-like receiver, AAA-type ATPase, and DNA-binding domains [Pleurocapsa sp. PCC 7327]MBF2021009.1 response regulator [Hydrococcus sp. C42_A2020_068]
MKVMVIDDEKDVQSLFTQKFRKEIRQGAINFSFAFSAEEALQTLKVKNSEYLVLILADINMPGMNGIELLKILKENYPQVKVFMITAYGDEQTYQIAMQYGADDYINKPIEFETLKKKIWNL